MIIISIPFYWLVQLARLAFPLALDIYVTFGFLN